MSRDHEADKSAEAADGQPYITGIAPYRRNPSKTPGGYFPRDDLNYGFRRSAQCLYRPRGKAAKSRDPRKSDAYRGPCNAKMLEFMTEKTQKCIDNLQVLCYYIHRCIETGV